MAIAPLATLVMAGCVFVASLPGVPIVRRVQIAIHWLVATVVSSDRRAFVRPCIRAADTAQVDALDSIQHSIFALTIHAKMVALV